MKIACLCVLISLHLCCLAQPDGSISPFRRDPAIENAMNESLKRSYNKDIASATGTFRKELISFYKARLEYLQARVGENAFITDVEVCNYLNGVAQTIIGNNPVLKESEIRIVFLKDWTANAANIGEGTIFFNVGLFTRLENEGQAAFALSHELAHLYLDHSNKRIRQRLAKISSEEFKNEIKIIEKAQFRQHAQIASLGLDLAFAMSKNSREQEAEADSLAVIFMKNSGYDLNDAIGCLRVLDQSDKSRFIRPDVSVALNTSVYPFKKSWLASDAITFTDESAKDTALYDSLKSHPDCGVRILAIQEFVANNNKSGNRHFVVNEPLFLKYKQSFDYAILNYLFETDQISFCLYYTLCIINSSPQDPVLHTLVGKCLNKMYNSQRAHQIGTIVDTPSPFYIKEYNNLLQMIQNLRLKELAAVCYSYLQEKAVLCHGNTEFNNTLQISKANYQTN